jgi:putative DNA primase/helicase
LKDETGGRRWWILEIAEIDLEAQKKIQLDRFWGQAYYRAQRERYYLDREETLLLNKQNQKYNPRERAVIEFIDEEYGDFDGVINRKISTKDLYLKFTNDTGISINNKDFGKLIKKLYNVNTKVVNINKESFRIYERKLQDLHRK